ncbi:O-spanin [Klebsiella phage Pylas]|uniref:O-spanin n=1 Tax=Klebsiella phage Pylas TaxID=2419682 RepID=A0A3G3BYH0_9CAUD|nr:Rz-like spanin [Klebsiella phage Pylas]AYP69333.1 O-spanin [Klebsiella phage Pylas]
MKKMLTISSLLMLLLVSVGCSSQKPVLQPVSSPEVQEQRPAAWSMEPHSNSLQLLDETFSVSEEE